MTDPIDSRSAHGLENLETPRDLDGNSLDSALPCTESICPECLKTIPASRVPVGTDVYLVKTCPQHGTFRSIIWRGKSRHTPEYASWYRAKLPNKPTAPQTARERGCPLDCGLCPEHQQQTCCVLLEVTSRCNLNCPICFASSGGSSTPDPSLDMIRHWYRLLKDSIGASNIQLSGGEPTVRDDLPAIIAMGRDMGFSFFQVNTNGLRLASEPGYARRLKDAGLSTVFLQFDGLSDDIYHKTRGRALLAEKEAAIANSVEAGLGVVLVPTLIPGVNTNQVGRIIKYALRMLPGVRGVHFQPISYFGRYPQAQAPLAAPVDEERYTLPELMWDIETQTGGLIPANTFRPSCCEHPLCSLHGDYLLMEDGSVKPLGSQDLPHSAGNLDVNYGSITGSTCCCNQTNSAVNPAEKKRAYVARHWSSSAAEDICYESYHRAPGRQVPAGTDVAPPADLTVAPPADLTVAPPADLAVAPPASLTVAPGTDVAVALSTNPGSAGPAPLDGVLPTAAGHECQTNEIARHLRTSTPAPKASCSIPTLDELVDRLRNHSFTITAMAFQDVWTLDLERLRNCCLHVVSRDNRIIPFCAYNLTDVAGRPLYRPLAPMAPAPRQITLSPEETASESE